MISYLSFFESLLLQAIKTSQKKLTAAALVADTFQERVKVQPFSVRFELFALTSLITSIEYFFNAIKVATLNCA